ncbi:uncharacterized protein LOC103830334 isoform X2 [Brassica rapa]|uniref:uncharacterized protein LOC103830334 isoform X2 n=1 Tax=Brassica campestris TaxID=3711 RepID=UPI00142D3DD6|nr:uncharacterized protein LOC103830334 isoform X2 [Brassica rapa]
MALLVISSFQSQLRPPARLRTPSPSSVSTPPSVSFVSTPPSDSESRLHPPTPLIRLRNPSLPSRLRPASHLSRPCPASPPSKLQVHPPPDPPPCTYPPVLPEARSPPKPPDPPDVPFNLVLLLMSDTASSQLVSKTPDLKSLMLNLVPVFSDGVISLVCVDDTSFVSKCLSPAVCSVFLYWCVDWSLHRFSPRDFIYPPLPFIMLVIVVVDSTMGCSIPIPNSISVSLPLPLIQVLSQRFLNLILGNVLLKIRDTSNTEVLIKGFVAMLKIVDCALVAASILGFISLPVVTNFQGFILLYSSMVAEIRGLLDIISCLNALYAPIFLCCICFLVIAVCCLPWMALSSCMHTFSIYGE